MFTHRRTHSFPLILFPILIQPKCLANVSLSRLVTIAINVVDLVVIIKVILD